ncbi:MAG TPA: type II toxin-antitoxin system VapC family toxin [Candidatus Udaeobacter sp.]|nr:type II toxin-antitoxin system VapC family toxin [Candidatus Udaeobacter sp.]
MAPLIDTHVWIWWLTRLPRLSPRIISILDEMPERPFLSVASLWELSLLVEIGRIELMPSAAAWLEQATHPDTVQLAQITRSVALELFAFPKKFRRDPADRMIIATARSLNLPLLTYDRGIRKSGLVKIWKPR